MLGCRVQLCEPKRPFGAKSSAFLVKLWSLLQREGRGFFSLFRFWATLSYNFSLTHLTGGITHLFRPKQLDRKMSKLNWLLSYTSAYLVVTAWEIYRSDNTDIRVRRRKIGQGNTGYICTSGREKLTQFSVPKCYLWRQTKAFYWVDFQRRNFRWKQQQQFHFLCCFYSMKCPSVSLLSNDTNLPNVKELQRIENTLCVFISLVVIAF